MALERRYRLLPYLYTAFHVAHKDGQPVMAPVFFADPKDESLRAEEQSFHVGDRPVDNSCICKESFSTQRNLGKFIFG